MDLDKDHHQAKDKDLVDNMDMDQPVAVWGLVVDMVFQVCDPLIGD